MCGIAGVIGRSKNKDVTYQLITRLLANCESRGKDAAGFWGTEVNDGKILYHKEPGKASDFVKKESWKSISKINFDLMIVHARGASTGVGGPLTNKNNHPFTTADRSIGLIHNGRVQDSEYDVLKKQWELFSKCDSEILLRIFESGELYTAEELNSLYPELDTGIAVRLVGLRDVWKLVHKSHMAIAIGERIKYQNERRLWLCRNHHRPLWLADMRSTIGQIFFVSTPEIWQNSVLQTPSVRRYLNNRIKLIELPTEEIWMLSIDEQNGIVDDGQLLKFEVCSMGSYKEWKPNEQKIELPKGDPVADVITWLNEEEDVIKDVSGFQSRRKYNKSNDHACFDTGYVDCEDDVDPSQKGNTVPFNCRSVVSPSGNGVATERSNGSQVSNTRSGVNGAYGAGARTDHNTAATHRQSNLKNNRSSAMQAIEEKIKSIRDILDDIDVLVTNYGVEDSISSQEYSDLLYSLEHLEMDLRGTVTILEDRSC